MTGVYPHRASGTWIVRVPWLEYRIERIKTEEQAIKVREWLDKYRDIYSRHKLCRIDPNTLNWRARGWDGKKREELGLFHDEFCAEMLVVENMRREADRRGEADAYTKPIIDGLQYMKRLQKWEASVHGYDLGLFDNEHDGLLAIYEEWGDAR